MEFISRSESSGIAAAATLESILTSAVESVLLGAGKSLFWLLCVMGSSQNGANLFDEGCGIIKGFPLSSLRKIKDEPVPENKDDGESDDEEDEDDDEVGDPDDDGGEEDYSGEEGNEEEDEDELENGDGGSEDEDGDGDEDDDDEDEDGDEEDDEDAEEEDDDENEPPLKKQK